MSNWTAIQSITMIVSCLLTLLLFGLGFFQYKKQVKNFELDLYLKLKKDFWSEQSKLLSRSIRENNIYLEEKDGIQILVRHDIDSVSQQKSSKPLSIDLLNHIEDLALFYNNRMISKSSIISGYGSAINAVYECSVIQSFITYVQKRGKGDKQLYSGLESLYRLINKPQ